MDPNPYAPPLAPYEPPLPPMLPAGEGAQPWQIGEVVGFASAAVRASWPIVVPSVVGYFAIDFGLVRLGNAMVRAIEHAPPSALAVAWVRAVTAGVAHGFLLPGVLRVLLAAARRERVSIELLFRDGSRIVPMGIYGLAVSAIPLLFGLLPLGHPVAVTYVSLFVTALSLYTGLNFAQYYIVDQNLGAFAAFRASWQATGGQHAKVLLYAFTAVLIFTAGAILCGVGILYTSAVAMMGDAVIYTRISGHTRASLAASDG